MYVHRERRKTRQSSVPLFRKKLMKTNALMRRVGKARDIVVNSPNWLKKTAFILSVTAAEVMTTGIGMCDVDLKQVMGKILGVLTTVFLYVGILLMAWGIGQLVLAFKNEDADSKSRSIMLIVASVFLIAIKPFLEAVIGTTGTDITIDDSWGG